MPLNLDRFGALKLKSPYFLEKGRFENLKAELKQLDETSDCILLDSAESAFFQQIHFLIRKISIDTGKNHFLFLETETEFVYELFSQWAPLGIIADSIKIDKQGKMDLEDLKAKINRKTAALVIPYADLLTGVIQPVAKIYEIAKEKQLHCFIHIGNEFELIEMPKEFDSLAIQGLLLSRNYTYDIKGIEEVERLESFFSQYRLNRERFLSDAMHLIYKRRLFEKRLEEKVGAHIFFKEEERLPCTVVASFPFVRSDALLFQLVHRGVFATIGGHGFAHLEKILLKAGFPYELAMNAISFSFCNDFDEKMIDKTVTLIEEGLSHAVNMQ